MCNYSDLVKTETATLGWWAWEKQQISFTAMLDNNIVLHYENSHCHLNTVCIWCSQTVLLHVNVTFWWDPQLNPLVCLYSWLVFFPFCRPNWSRQSCLRRLWGTVCLFQQQARTPAYLQITQYNDDTLPHILMSLKKGICNVTAFIMCAFSKLALII